MQTLVVDPRDEVRGEVDDLLEALRRDVEQVAEPARDTLEVPDVRDRRGELDVAHALAPHLRTRDLDAAALADDALEADPLVLAAVALPVLRGTEDLLAEEPVLLRLERAVVDRLRLLHLAVRPREDVTRRREVDREPAAGVDVENCVPWLRTSLLRVAASSSSVPRSGLDRSMPERFGGAERVLVELADLDLLAVLVDHADVQAQRLHLLDEHLEALGDARLGDVLALDDRLVHLHAAEHVVGLDGEDLLERVRGAVGLERPHLHLTEPLAAELRLTAERLLRDHRVRARRTSVDLVVDEVRQLQDVHVADGDRAVERLAGAAVVQRDLAVGADQLLAVGAVGVEPLEQLADRARRAGLLDLVPVRAVEHRARRSTPRARYACASCSARRACGARRPSRGAPRSRGALRAPGRRSYGSGHRAG